MWGEGDGREEAWPGDASAAISAGSNTLMAFNEPELASQANIPDPGDCASKYMTYMQPYAGQARLCSPSVTDDPSPNKGLDYMRQFLDACKTLGCTVDILCIHVYKTYDAIDYFKQQLIDAYALTGNQTNIWVTEWGVTNGTPDQQAAYMQEAIAFMDSQPWVERESYFYIDPSDPILVDGSGAPSALGEVYISSS
jgi:Glycosyl hydrolase catalytic core